MTATAFTPSEEVEAELRFIEAAEAADADYNATGQHITLDEAKAWAKALKTNRNAPMPACHG